MNKRKKEDGSLMEFTIMEAPPGKQKITGQSQKTWSAFLLGIHHGDPKEV
jgi:hypothetical protein